MPSDITKESIKAIHDYDLEKLLERLGILHKIKRGEFKCKFCRHIITMNNLHSLFPQSGDVKIVCDKIECVKALSDLLREREIKI